MAPSITVVRPGETRKRFHRRPNFPIAGTMKPFGLYPIMCHPVLPGETLKSSKMKWSVISQPLANPFGGAWLESWVFYVKLTDLDRDLGQMFISDTYSTDGWLNTGARDHFFTGLNQIDWIRKCVDRVRDAFFSDEDQTAPNLGGVHQNIPMMKMNTRSWYQNLMFEPAEVALDTTGERDHTEQMSAYQMLTQMQLTELTYEKYLEQYGVQSMNLGIGEPEILRYNRSWTKPVNHVNPINGTPSSAWVWNDEMNIEKDKRFEEPGFVIMMAGIRPKMFQKRILYSMVGNLWGFTDWYPAYNLTDPAAGVRRIGTDDIVFETDINAAEGEVQLLYDHRDLLNHGEQFVNDWTNNPYPHPASNRMSTIAAAAEVDIRGEYAAVVDIEALFLNSSGESDYLCQYDGIVGLTIAGHVTDTTV